MQPPVFFAHRRIIVDTHVIFVTKRNPRFHVEHELPPTAPVMHFCGFTTAADTVWGYELASWMGEEEGFTELSIFKVEGMAFGDVFSFWSLFGFGLYDEAPVFAHFASLALAVSAAFAGKDA